MNGELPQNPPHRPGRFWKIVGLIVLFATILIAGVYLIPKGQPKLSQEEMEEQMILLELSRQAELQPELSDEEKQMILEELSGASGNTPILTDEEKAGILESLNQ